MSRALEETSGTQKERLALFDTTLRDGQQTQGVDFSVHDKRLICDALDRLGVDYIEGGWPGANPTDTAFFNDPPPLKNARLVAFGMTRRAGRSAANDPGLSGVLNAPVPTVCLVGKSWDYHVDIALNVAPEENLSAITDSFREARARGKEALFDAEHFFDGFKANRAYALACLEAALEGGAQWVVLCDTNGGTLPEEVEEIVRTVKAQLPEAQIGIHTHNDTEQAVANSLAAVRGGARHIQGTLNGLGERCGNANLTALIPTLCLKPGYQDRFETRVTPERLTHLTHASRLLDEVLNRAPNRHAAYTGAAAFAHKGGLHVSAVAKDPKTYEHVPPESVGNQRQILVSDQAGKSNVLARLQSIGIDLAAEDDRVGAILTQVKDLEYKGYTFDGAEASFELLARRALGQVPEFFKVQSFRVLVERRFNALGKRITVSEATVKLKVKGEEIISVGEGNGPVNALDMALRKDLGCYNGAIADLKLVDFKVRILTSGTEAVTRVMIESTDSAGESWFTVGVSPNIMDASFEALLDSITYKLYRHQRAQAAE